MATEIKKWKTKYEPGPLVDCPTVMDARRAGYEEVYSAVGDTPAEALDLAINRAADMGGWTATDTTIEDMNAEIEDRPYKKGFTICRLFLSW